MSTQHALEGAWLTRLRRTPLRVAAVGDNCLDVYVDTGRTNIGGNAVNVAIDLLDDGIPADFVGRVGDDADGRRIVETLADLGIRARTVVETTPTCRGLLRIGDDGTTELVGTEGDCSYFTVGGELLDAFDEYSVVFMKAVDRSDEVIDALRVRGIPSAYDYSVFHDEIGRSTADISIVSGEERDDDEVRALLERLRDRGARLSVVTRGARGSLALAGDELIETPAHVVDVVDTIGAGDAFVAGLLSGLLRGHDIRTALVGAAERGSATCTFEGAWRTPAGEAR